MIGRHTCLALERVVTRLAVDQHLTGNDTHSSTRSQAIQKSRFTSTRDTHERSQGTRLDPSINVVEDTTRLLLDGDIVADVLPLEDGGLAFDDGDVVGTIVLNRDVACRSSGFQILFGLALGRGEFVATLEDKDLTLGLLGGDEFSTSEVDTHETEHEDPHDSEVAPLVLCVVVEGRVDVSITTDERLSGNRADGPASLLSTRNVFVAGAERNELIALELPVVEFVDHERLETVTNRVDVADPLGPAQHVAGRDSETSVHDETQDEDGGGCESLNKRAGQRGDRTEEHGHDERQCEGDEDEEEEVAGLSSEVCHEVQDQVESDRIDNLVWHIGQHTGKGFSGRVVQGVTRVLFDNGTLSVKRQDLEGGTESVHQDGEEEKGGSRVETRSSRLEVEEDGRDDKTHDGVGDELRDGDTGVSLQANEASPQAKLHLLHVRERVRRLLALTLSLLELARLFEALAGLATNGVLLLVSFDLL